MSASCTPYLAEGPALETALPPAELLDQSVAPAQLASLIEPQAQAAVQTVAPGGLLDRPVGTSIALAFRGRTPLDQLRSHDCLAQAIYFEAASESEVGQRAVAQVVLNRVRHPSWPNSVCGVVYQGPMRPGGGCQFTFTCDGSLSRRPAGLAWQQARRIATEALAGRNHAPVGLATHYHTHAVSPAWAPRLTQIGTIGAHKFYRLPGRWGETAAFAEAYSGTEPLPRPTLLFPRNPPTGTGLAALADATSISSVTAPIQALPSAQNAASAPAAPTTVREEYRQSGQWRSDAPAALTGRPVS